MSDVTFIPVDDQDSRVSYNGTWFVTPFAQAYNGTVTFSTTPGDTIRFKFTGIQITVFGTVRPLKDNAQVAAAFSVDGTSPSFYSYPKVSEDEFQVIFFYSPPLSNGVHEIEVTVVAATPENAFIFDLFGVIPQAVQSSASVSYITSSISTPTSTVFVTREVFRDSKVPLGPIIGGVLGGLALILGALFAAWFLLRRHRRGQAYFYRKAGASEMLEDEIKLTELPDTVEPYTQPQSSAPSSSRPTVTRLQSGSSSPLGESSRTQSQMGSGSQPSGRTTSLSMTNPDGRAPSGSNQPYSKAAEAGLRSAPEGAAYHSDSGYRFSTVGEPSASGSGQASGSGLLDSAPLVDVPPEYSET